MIEILENFVRTGFRRLLTKGEALVLENKIPSLEVLEAKFRNIEELGLYLHIPFCEQICSYCPYNKEIYTPEAAKRYVNAVKKEIYFYSEVFGDKPITSFYIGGGTPTTMLRTGLADILEYIFSVFKMQCDIHMESHPNHLTNENLKKISDMGVRHLSAGVEALQERHLRTLKRPYTVKEAQAAIERAVNMGFECVNADLMFALPDQTLSEIKDAGQTLVKMGVGQVAAYPLFRFPYTKMGGDGRVNNFTIPQIFRRRRMLSVLEDLFYENGYERTSVWAFTKKGIPRYCSVTVPLYVGLGASGGSYLRDVFYLNTFNVAEYCNALESGRMPIALSLELTETMQMAGWLYWRLYETRFNKSDFRRRFGKEFNDVYGNYMKLLSFLGFMNDNGKQTALTDSGAYWLHSFEDLFSINYVSKLWGTSKTFPWPQRVVL
jgi:coproporphyrinogen III oxidase-like Fe-S oxidoreductase